GRARGRRRRLPGQAVRHGRAPRAPGGAPAPLAAPAGPAAAFEVRGPRPRRAHLEGHARRLACPPDHEGVPHPGGAHARDRRGPDARTDTGRGLGRRGGCRVKRGRRPRRQPATKARSRRSRAADPDNPRRRVHTEARRMTLRLRLTLAYIGLLIPALVAFSVVVYFIASSRLYGALDDDIESRMEAVDAQLPHDRPVAQSDVFANVGAIEGPPSTGYSVRILDRTGRVLYASPAARTREIPDISAFKPGSRFMTSETRGQNLR